MRNLILAVLALSLNSCASLVTSPYHASSQYAPLFEKREGIVSYSYISFHHDMDREAAYKLMHDSCGGAYEITSEEKGSYFGNGENALFLHFRCVDKGESTWISK